MAIPSQVSKPRATYHYFTNMQNLLLTAGTLCFLGKLLVNQLGKDVKNFPSLDKISNCTMNYFAFYDFASAARALYSTYSVLSDGASVLSKEKDSDELRVRREGDFPRADNPYIGGKIWMTYKTISTLFKAISSVLLVHEAFKRIGSLEKSFSPNVRAIGAGLGAVGFVIDIIDTNRAIYDHKKDVNKGDFPSDGKVKVKDSVEVADLKLHRSMAQGARNYDLVFFALIIGAKLMGATRALNMVDYEGLIGRVSRFAINNTENCYGFLSTAMTASGLIQHALYGATIQQLEKRNVNK